MAENKMAAPKQEQSSAKHDTELKLYIALLLMGLCPTIYSTVRIHLLGQVPGDWAYSIAGQLSWVSLIYEVMNESIILPLYYFLGRTDKKEFANRLKSGLIVTAVLYTMLSILVSVFTVPLLEFMAITPELIPESAVYIRLESIAFVFSVLFDFALVALVTIGERNNIYLITLSKCILSIIFDMVFISSLPFSLKLGVNGIAVTNILSNLLLFVMAIFLVSNSIHIDSITNISYTWVKDALRIDGISGAESFVRNTAYTIMISRMVNMVGEQGVYWVANSFIWGWLLLPILQLGELIKRDVAESLENIQKNIHRYYKWTCSICAVWILMIPLYKPFMVHVLGYTDVDKLYHLVMLLIISYVFFSFQNIYDSIFYGSGKTQYMLFEAVVTNSVFYGACFLLYKINVWQPTLDGIAIMFGLGNIFDSVVSYFAYKYFLKKYQEK